MVAAILAILFSRRSPADGLPSFGKTVLIPTQQVLVLKNLAKPAALTGAATCPRRLRPNPAGAAETQPILVSHPRSNSSRTRTHPQGGTGRRPPGHQADLAELNLDDIRVRRVVRAGAVRVRAGARVREPARLPLGTCGRRRQRHLSDMGAESPTPSPSCKRLPATPTPPSRQGSGCVWLQAIILKDGNVDSFKVIRGLVTDWKNRHPGDCTNWRFRPRNAQWSPVDVLATIEVQFNLR